MEQARIEQLTNVYHQRWRASFLLFIRIKGTDPYAGNRNIWRVFIKDITWRCQPSCIITPSNKY